MDLRERILRCCFERGKYDFAGGAQANNKLNMENLESHLALRAKAAVRVAELIRIQMPEKPELIIGVPNGGDWLAGDVAHLIGGHVLTLDKDSTTKEISFKPRGREILNLFKSAVIVDDVLNELTNTGKVYALPDMHEKVGGVFAIWDRNPGRTNNLGITTSAVFEETIPPVLPDDSPFFNFALN
jgi:orotate phosphoribosyltransferase